MVFMSARCPTGCVMTVKKALHGGWNEKEWVPQPGRKQESGGASLTLTACP